MLFGFSVLFEIFFGRTARYINSYSVWRFESGSTTKFSTEDIMTTATGKIITDFGGIENGESIAVQADGKILVAGYIFNGTRFDKETGGFTPFLRTLS